MLLAVSLKKLPSSSSAYWLRRYEIGRLAGDECKDEGGEELYPALLGAGYGAGDGAWITSGWLFAVGDWRLAVGKSCVVLMDMGGGDVGGGDGEQF